MAVSLLVLPEVAPGAVFPPQLVLSDQLPLTVPLFVHVWLAAWAGGGGVGKWRTVAGVRFVLEAGVGVATSGVVAGAGIGVGVVAIADVKVGVGGATCDVVAGAGVGVSTCASVGIATSGVVAGVGVSVGVSAGTGVAASGVVAGSGVGVGFGLRRSLLWR